MINKLLFGMFLLCVSITSWTGDIDPYKKIMEEINSETPDYEYVSKNKEQLSPEQSANLIEELLESIKSVENKVPEKLSEEKKYQAQEKTFLMHIILFDLVSGVLAGYLGTEYSLTQSWIFFHNVFTIWNLYKSQLGSRITENIFTDFSISGVIATSISYIGRNVLNFGNLSQMERDLFLNEVHYFLDFMVLSGYGSIYGYMATVDVLLKYSIKSETIRNYYNSWYEYFYPIK